MARVCHVTRLHGRLQEYSRISVEGSILDLRLCCSYPDSTLTDLLLHAKQSIAIKNLVAHVKRLLVRRCLVS